jgi:hypothetical protein
MPRKQKSTPTLKKTVATPISYSATFNLHGRSVAVETVQTPDGEQFTFTAPLNKEQLEHLHAIVRESFRLQREIEEALWGDFPKYVWGETSQKPKE